MYTFEICTLIHSKILTCKSLQELKGTEKQNGQTKLFGNSQALALRPLISIVTLPKLSRNAFKIMKKNPKFKKKM